jgi:glycosyltransferase involved in cell wall biosynthesis
MTQILMISTDRKLLEEGSAVHSRILRYAEYVDELHIILFSKKNDTLHPTPHSLGPNTFVYPTKSRNRWWYVWDGIKIGERILKGRNNTLDWVISAQDATETGLVGWRLKTLFNTPLQLQVHTDIFSPHYASTSFLNRIRVYFAKFLLPRADCVRVVSERIKRSLTVRGISEKKISVLPIFSSFSVASHLSPAIFPFETTILMVGRLEKEKDVVMGIRAFAEIVNRDKNVGLVIVGDGSLRVELEREVGRLGIAHMVQFVGWVNDVAPYYAQADIFLHTSRYEGYGLALVEAASHGLAIITTDVGVVGELLVDNESALVCVPGDILCLSQHISCLLTENELPTAVGTSAKRAIQKTVSLTGEGYYRKQCEAWQICLQRQ